MSLQTYTAIHVILSLIGIGSGLVVLAGLLTQAPRQLDRDLPHDDCADQRNWLPLSLPRR